MATAASGNRRGRPAKPTVLKILHGDDKINPSRVNRREPKPSGRLQPPDHISPQARELWLYLVPEMQRSGMMTYVDAPALAEWCECMVLVRLARGRVVQAAAGKLEIKPGQSTPTNEYVRLLLAATGLGGRLGLTPADRARLISAVEASGDEGDDIRWG